MTCAKKIYDDGEYTLCGGCYKAQGCIDAKRCYNCGETNGVAYERRWDVFSCGECLERLESRVLKND